MGKTESREIHHYHEDEASKELARQTQEQMKDLRWQMEQQQRMSEENHQKHQEALLKLQEEKAAELWRLEQEQAQNEQRHQEALRRAEELRADEKAAALQRLQQEQENRKRDAERARAELEQQAREAEDHLAQELQRERDNAHKAKLEKWQRLKRDYPIPDFLKNYVNEVSEDSAADADRELHVNVGHAGGFRNRQEFPDQSHPEAFRCRLARRPDAPNLYGRRRHA